MKNKILYMILASLMLVPACSDYLDQDPGGMNTIDKVFASEVSTKEWYARMYSDDFMVQEMHYSGQIPYFWCTDEAAYVMEGNIKGVSEGLMSPDNYYGYTVYNLYFFVRYYQAIRHINIFLENLDKCQEMGELERRVKRAEARFMRAYYHYLLLRLYGPIPVVESSRGADAIAAPQARKPFAECVQWISDEIDWACENGMPETRNETLELGLPTVAAARAIQSRMYLMAASPLYNGNTIYASWTNNDGTVLIPQQYDKELWKEAADRAKDIIDNYGFSLKKAPEKASFDEIVDNIRSITTTWGAENNPEVIWAHPNSMQWYGMCALPARWFGWNGRYSLAIGMVNDFFMADGSVAPELETWFDDKKFSEEAGNGTIANTFWMFCNREPRFYANVHFPNQRLSYASPTEPDAAQDADGYGIVDFWYSGKSGNGSTPGDKNTTGFSVRKNIPLDYTSNKEKSTATRMMNCPFPIIRLGEIYLNYAEAVNEYYGEAEQDEVLKYLNEIRARAGIPAYEGSYSQEEMREMIRHERKVELCYECQRWFDVRRWFIAHGPEGVFNHNEYGLDMSKGTGPTDKEFFTLTQAAIKRFDIQHYFMPVKASECELNTELVQAPFY
ncbi:MAG: RagB/SusD family nutrient uptake outer membrane protein [Bacteroidales bacterium]|nr:RagB/SusD family nutrient uptake outer membrane protein [Bacteroidales bacterium]